MCLSEASDDGGKGLMFFLHFLVMAATLLGLPAANEDFHGFEDLVHPAHMSVDEVFVVYF